MARTRRTWNTKGMWAAGIALAAVLALTGYAALSGSDDDPQAAAGGASPGASAPAASPTASYQAPQDWSEPKRWTALPRAAGTDRHGSPTGFPHTTEGAVAMLAAANTTDIEGGTSAVDEQLRIYSSYVAAADQSAEHAEQIELQAQETDKGLHRQMGVSAGQDLPSGAYVRSTVVGYKVVRTSADEAGVWLLSRVVQKNGETAAEDSSYTRVLNGAQWTDGDWKLSGAATERALQAVKNQAQPPMVAPGDAAFNDGGWTAIRAAS